MAELNIPAELLAEAERFGLDVSGELTSLLRRPAATAKDRTWQKENREKVEAWNEWVAENGLPLEKHRQF